MSTEMGDLTASRTLPSRALRSLNPLLFGEQLSPSEPRSLWLSEVSAASIDWESTPATMGDCQAMQALRSRVRRIAPHFRTALLTGPSGTGKQGVARMLHALSPGHASSFLSFQAADLAEAIRRTGGQVLPHLSPSPEAQTTLFLDEICDVPSALQANLLTLWSVGSRCTLRVVAGTHMDLHTMTLTGQFHADLLQKLGGVEIALPPLSGRRTEIAPIAEAMVSDPATGSGPIIADEAMDVLRRHHWPGDLAELEKVLDSALTQANGSPVLRAEHLPALAPEDENTPPDDSERLDEVVQRHVLAVLTRCRGNKVRAAEVLGISRSTLYRMLESRINPDFAHGDRDQNC